MIENYRAIARAKPKCKLCGRFIIEGKHKCLRLILQPERSGGLQLALTKKVNMTIFHIGELRREANINVTPMGKIIVNDPVKRHIFRLNTAIQPQRSNKMTCDRKGWDDEEGKDEACGARYDKSGCSCHPSFCPDCSAETHGLSLTLPGVMESSSIGHHCSTKGNHG